MADSAQGDGAPDQESEGMLSPTDSPGVSGSEMDWRSAGSGDEAEAQMNDSEEEEGPLYANRAHDWLVRRPGFSFV